ncbi:MAG TPA: LacI family DNA-binding transcriptional regulator [Anaerolineaceae bacterium]|nr:LacI family DNA-binding transcriptional regulator [Anaerolineaceae bacterium]
MKKKNSPTIVDVAKLASLSPATVSRVLNNSGYFSEETLIKVENAAKELEYIPNMMARGLKGKPSQLIGLVIPDLSNVFYTSVASSTLSILHKYDYEMILCVTDEDPQKDLAYLRMLKEICVDGIMYTHPVIGNNSDYLHAMVKAGIPIIEVNRQREIDLLDSVLHDNYRGVQQVINYLLELGHKRIAIISGSTSTTTGLERVTGYKNFMLQAGMALDQDLIKIGSFTRAYGEQAVSELLNLSNPPTAIFAASNRITLGVLNMLNHRKISVPSDISVAGFDDSEWMSVWNPPITTVGIAINEMTQLAVDLLHRRITKELTSTKPIAYRLGVSLIIRESCQQPAGNLHRIL